MELWELKDRISSNNIPNFLIFTGPEVGLMDIYINQIAKVLQTNPKRLDSITEVISNSKILSLTQSNKYSIVRGDKSFLSSEKLQGKIKTIKDYIIVIYDNIDKRSKLYKEFEDNIITFNYMDEKTLISLLSRKIKLNQDNLKWLVDACGHDYARCLLEINKLNLFDDDKDILFEEFKKDGVIHADIGDVIFQFVDAVLTRKKASSWKLYELLKLKGESNIKIISLLYTNFKALLSVQFCKEPTIENTGLTAYQISINKHRKGIYKDRELLDIIELLANTDYNIKRGIIEESISIEYLLVKIL